MKKRQRVKRSIVMLLVCALILSGCSTDATSNGNTSVTGSRVNDSNDSAGTIASKNNSQYGILVLNQKGEVLPGATVTLDGVAQQTGDNGFAKFNKPSKSSVDLIVTCQGYYGVHYPALSINKKKMQSQITLKSSEVSSHRLKSAVYTNKMPIGEAKVDLLQDCKLIYKNERYKDFSIEATVLADAGKVSGYELHQQTGTTDKLIASSTSGLFEHLSYKNFQEGTGVYVIVKDTSGHRSSTALNLEVGADPQVKTATSISLGDALEFEVSDRVPILGGTTMKLDVPDLPIVQKEGVNDEGEPFLRIGFNLNENVINDEASMKEFKKCMDSMRYAKKEAHYFKRLRDKIKERQKTQGLMNMTKFDKGIEFSATGYVEAGYDSKGQVSKGTGYLCITAEGSAEFDWQFVVWVIPVVVNVKGQITADLASTICYSVKDNSFEGTEASLTLKPGLTIKAGAGFKYLSAGLYGSAELEAKLVIASVTQKAGFDSVDMNTSIGLYGKVGPFEADKDMWQKGNISLYKRSDKDKKKTTTKKTADDNISSEIYDIDNYKPIQQADESQLQTTSLEDGDAQKRAVLAYDINEGAKPVLESNGNRALAMFTTQQNLNGAEYTYSKLYFSVYENGEWSDSVALDTKVCNEMNPVLYRNGNEVYIAYQETTFDYSQFNGYDNKTQEEQKQLMKNFWKSVDLHVKKYNLSTKSFSDLGTITTSGQYDYNASMTMYGGKLFICWARNSEGDVFGTDADVTNYLCYTSYSGGWGAIRDIKWDVKNVTYLEAGQYKGSFAFVYTTDEDNDMSTWDDIGTYMYYNGEFTKIRTGKVNQLLYSKVPGSGDFKFMVSEDGSLYAYENGDWETVLGNTGSYDDSFAITDRAVYYEKKTENGAELFGCYKKSDGSLGEATQITNEENWLRDVVFCNAGDYDVALGMEDILEDSVKVQTNMVSYQIGKYYDLELEEAYIDYEDTFNEGMIPVHITVKNTGTKVIPGEKFVVMDASGKTMELADPFDAQTIDVGESVTFDLNLAINENTSFGDWSVEGKIISSTETTEGTVETELEEPDQENNQCTMKTGFSDFVVRSSLNNAGGYPYLIVEVKNNGTVSDSTQLKIYNANDMTKELYSEETGKVEVGETKIFKVKVKSDWQDANGKTAMLVKALETENEIYSYNNFSYQYATSNYGKYKINYQLNGGKNSSYNPNTYLTTDTIELRNPYRSGYTFLGWYTTSGFDANTQIAKIDAGAAGDITVYAQWVKNKTTSSTTKKTTKKSTKTKVAKVKIKSAKNKKKRKIALTWKKVKGAKGYKVQYSTSKKFAKKKTKTKYCKKTKLTLKKLKKKKKYYIRVRAYKLQGKRKKVYGKWSKVKMVKVKK